LLCIGFSRGVGSTRFAVILDVTPDVEGDKHYKGNNDNDIKAVEDRAKLLVVLPQYRTNISKQEAPGQRAKKRVDGELYKWHLGDASR
jgi:hypothetical protein